MDLVVCNLGTEHRATGKDLQYHGEVSRGIRDVIGHKIVLHGTSSVPNDQVRKLYNLSLIHIFGGSELIITDELTNNTPSPMEYMVLYHMNFGYPFLTPDLQMKLPEGTATTPRTEEAAKGLGQERCV